jgi:uncharacterized protein
MSDTTLLMAHGAGVGHSSLFFEQFSAALCRTLNVQYRPMTFEYMKKMESTGTKRPPNKLSDLVIEFNTVIEHSGEVIVAGKSMGGRVAAQCTQHPNVRGVICLGFPFYPAGKPEKHRLAFLNNMQCPCLIIQGTRDALGNKAWVSEQALPQNITVKWIDGADHDFHVLKSLNRCDQDVMNEMTRIIHNWIQNL